MHILITHSNRAQTRVLRFNRWQLAFGLLALGVSLLGLAGVTYHFVFVTAAREGWPVVSPIVKLVVRDEFAQRDRFLRENLDVMAKKVGEMQAKLLKLESMGDRVSSLAGVKPEEFKPLLRPAAPSASAPPRAGMGGPFIPALGSAELQSLDSLNAHVGELDERTDQTTDLFTLIESRLLEGRLAQLMVPSSAPIVGPVGSGFGFRTDPFTGRPALHTGLDFPADVGTVIHAAAGGVVVTTDRHSDYGNMIELDHGNGLMTRYAHVSKLLVKTGDLVKRGQPVAEVGTSGRSTGPHLHFEVLVAGVPQNPARFLAGRAGEPRALAGNRRVP